MLKGLRLLRGLTPRKRFAGRTPRAGRWLGRESSQRLGFSAAWPEEVLQSKPNGTAPEPSSRRRAGVAAGWLSPCRNTLPVRAKAATTLKTDGTHFPPNTEVLRQRGRAPKWDGLVPGGRAIGQRRGVPSPPLGGAPARRGGQFQQVTVGQAAAVTLLRWPGGGTGAHGRREIFPPKLLGWAVRRELDELKCPGQQGSLGTEGRDRGRDALSGTAAAPRRLAAPASSNPLLPLSLVPLLPGPAVEAK